jgi:hypothetical protein
MDCRLRQWNAPPMMVARISIARTGAKLSLTNSGTPKNRRGLARDFGTSARGAMSGSMRNFIEIKSSQEFRYPGWSAYGLFGKRNIILWTSHS